MDGNTWIMMLTVAVLLVFVTEIKTSPNKQELLSDCLRKNVINGTIVDTGFPQGLILKKCSNNDEKTLECAFIFDTNHSSEIIRHRSYKYTFKDLKFWLKKKESHWHLDFKKARLNMFFKVMPQGNTSEIPSVDLDIKKLCDRAEYNYCGETDDFIYRINITSSGIVQCVKCGNPVPPAPEVDVTGIIPKSLFSNNEDYDSEPAAQTVDPAAASKAMKKMSEVSKLMGNLSLASISIGEVKGLMVKPEDEDDLQKLSFVSSDSALNLIEDEDAMKNYPLSVSVSEEAYKKAYNNDKANTFVGVFRFPNMTGENVTALTGQVYAIDMGTNISNLSEPIEIRYNTVPQEEFTFSCQSWDGEGDLPNWTDSGCLTTISDQVICQCSHLTFFAVLMTPIEQNSTISASDLTSLTYISFIGCGVSLFFLGIALFMFCCIRKAKASNGIHILIHLLLALFLLNTAFLTNEWVANTGNTVACKIIAGFMHYSMLSSFSWFAVEAFHLCLQLTKYATVTIANYKLKLCCAGWIPGALVVLILFSLGKYGELRIYADDGTVAKMCWILDGRLQYAVNISYYAIVFAFTFTIFVVMLRWLCYLSNSKAKAGGVQKQDSTKWQDVITIMGLCCMLGITWSFAFFSHGALRVPSFYIFTVLNSLQGFFLFLYYYNTSRVLGDGDMSSSSSTKTSTSKIDTDNPYM